VSRLKASRRPARPSRKRSGGLGVSRATLWRTGVVLTWVGTFVGAAFGLHQLDSHQRALAAREPTQLRWTALPPWLEDPRQQGLLSEIEAQAGLRADNDLFEPALCERLARNLKRSPWVEDVHRVWKQPGGTVRVHASFRKPLTMAAKDGMAYLVDKSGVRLPLQQRAAHIKPGKWIIVRGVGGRVPPVGEQWQGEDLAAGLRLANFLDRAEVGGRLSFRTSLLAVDVGHFDSRTGGGLRVITINPRSYIHWGLPPGDEYDIEASAERKLEALNGLYAKTGCLPDRGPIDVRPQDRILIGEPR
jgi:hypothetical protein